MNTEEFTKYQKKVPPVFKNMIAAYESEEDLEVLTTVLMAICAENVILQEKIDALQKAHEAIMVKWAEFDKDNLFEKDDIAGMSDTEVMALIHDLLQEDFGNSFEFKVTDYDKSAI